MSVTKEVTIFDTTLRDGEQSPGASMNLQEKLEIAQALIDLGVNVIEAGFPIASPGDFEAVQQIASNFRGAQICGLARSNDKDIDRAWEALKQSQDPGIHVFLATSAIHREFKLKMTPDEIIARAVAGVLRISRPRTLFHVHVHHHVHVPVGAWHILLCLHLRLQSLQL